VIDISVLLNNGDVVSVSHKIREACLKNGFFSITNHGVPESLQAHVKQLSKDFFFKKLH